MVSTPDCDSSSSSLLGWGFCLSELFADCGISRISPPEVMIPSREGSSTEPGLFPVLL